MGKSIRGALSYNERKVSKGVAELILASGFASDINELGFTQKLKRFQSLIERNPGVRTNTLHLSVNFPPEENLTSETMQLIARDYMERIGFGGQPFLVYRHEDANHPHFHIVTTTIREKGNPVKTHNIAKERSGPARKAIEQLFGLIPAESSKRTLLSIPTALGLLPAEYGREETKHIITNIVGEVSRSYKFASLAEFNTILRQMNIIADRGKPGSLIYERGGLVFSIVGKDGQRIGQWIKASSIYGNVTLKFLQQKFSANAGKKDIAKVYTKNAVKSAIAKSRNLRTVTRILKTKNIRLDFDQDRLGIIKTAHFIDFRNKAVYTHQELGIALNDIYQLRAADLRTSGASTPGGADRVLNRKHDAWESSPLWEAPTASGLMHILFPSSLAETGSPGPPPKKKKKRKRPPL